jgi:hypothetical protein
MRGPSSKKVKVKYEPMPVRPRKRTLPEDGSAVESKDVELVLSFDNQTQMRLASKYATSVHRAIKCFGVMAILRTVRLDFKTAAYPDGLHSHILQYMPDDPAHAQDGVSGPLALGKEAGVGMHFQLELDPKTVSVWQQSARRRGCYAQHRARQESMNMLDRIDTIRARKVLHATNHAQLRPKE